MKFAVIAFICAGCATISPPFDGETRETFIFEPGKKAFSVLVYPRNTPRETAIEMVLERAHIHCLNQFQNSKVEIFSAKAGTLGTPNAWKVVGRCA